SQPAVVVTVLHKEDPAEVPASQLIPRKLGIVLVDVAPATPVQQLQAMGLTPQAAAALNPTHAVGVDPGIPGAAGPHAGLVPEAVKPKVDYNAPDGVPLDPVQDAMTLLCHAGPDASWRVLQAFLEGTEQKLTVAMYEVTAPNVATALEGAAQQAG